MPTGNLFILSSRSLLLDRYDNLEAAYSKASQRLQQQQQQQQPPGPNYKKFLRQLLGDKEFAASLWCGPYFECESPAGHASNDWILLYSLPLFDGARRLRGAASIKLRLTQLSLDQCASGDAPLAGTHKCKANSECVFAAGGGGGQFRLGGYACKCRAGFINSEGNFSAYEGALLESGYWLMKSVQNRSVRECVEKCDCFFFSFLSQ